MRFKSIMIPSIALTLISATSPVAAIVGGTADEKIAASSVMILKSNGGVCSGVVIAPDVVLTAAHCASGADQFRIHYRNADDNPVLLTPTARTIHPGYAADAVKARKPSVDLALFRLPEPLPSSFAQVTLSNYHPREGERITAGGYGLADIGNPRSAGTFRTATLVVTEPYGPGKILIWSKGEFGQIATGDSGGPQVSNNAVFAVTAWTEVVSKSPYRSLPQGILLGPQRAWIDKTLAGWGKAARWQN